MPLRRRGRGSWDVMTPLRKALVHLQAQKSRIDREIAVIERALSVLTGDQTTKTAPSRARKIARKPAMSAKARKALSQRMKVYWAKKRTAAKEKAKA